MSHSNTSTCGISVSWNPRSNAPDRSSMPLWCLMMDCSSPTEIRIAELAIKKRLPSIGFREYCEAGGLAAYGVDFPQIWRGAGALIDKVLKGRKPADLPIEQATRFEIILNLKTAKTLGFDVPPAMSARANEVIE